MSDGPNYPETHIARIEDSDRVIDIKIMLGSVFETDASVYVLPAGPDGQPYPSILHEIAERKLPLLPHEKYKPAEMVAVPNHSNGPPFELIYAITSGEDRSIDLSEIRSLGQNIASYMNPEVGHNRLAIAAEIIPSEYFNPEVLLEVFFRSLAQARHSVEFTICIRDDKTYWELSQLGESGNVIHADTPIAEDTKSEPPPVVEKKKKKETKKKTTKKKTAKKQTVKQTQTATQTESHQPVIIARSDSAAIYLTLADCYAVPADAYVIPIDHLGNVSSYTKDSLNQNYLPIPAHGNFELGHLIDAGAASNEPEAKRVFHAVTVSTGRTTTTAVIQTIAQRIAVDTATRPGIKHIATPILGSGTGKIPHLDAVRALRDGFLDGKSETDLTICVHNPRVFDQIHPILVEEGPGGSTPEGKSEGRGRSTQPATGNTNTPTHTDQPATIDLLQRRPFAQALARRIQTLRTQAEGKPIPFFINLHGPWGSGKSTILNFLKDEFLERNENNKPQSIVIDFNAWQQQKLGVPWWSLMNQTYHQAVQQLGPKTREGKSIRWKELDWRIKQGSGSYITVGVIFLILLAIPFFSLDKFSATAKALHTIFSFLVLLGGIGLTVRRTLLPGSAKAAKTFTETQKNPTRILSNHFRDLIRWISKPVIIFIDDADRCSAQYLVDLIESIQTLYHNAPVTYIFAADRRWICNSYEQIYKEHAPAVNAPGRPLGHLFLEKIFQMSIAVPTLPSRQLEKYWRHLIAEKQDPEKTPEADRIVLDYTQELAEAQTELKSVTSQTEIEEKIKSAQTPKQQQAIRHAAVLRLAESDMQKQMEQHLLLSFAPLLEPNPRALKRLVNAFGIQQSITILAGTSGQIDNRALALWATLSLRWPDLADYLKENPHEVNLIQYPKPKPVKSTTTGSKAKSSNSNASNPLDHIPSSIQPLFHDPAVYDVVHPNGIEQLKDISLDESTIMKITGHTNQHVPTDTSTAGPDVA